MHLCVLAVLCNTLMQTIRIKYRDHQFFRDFSEEDWEVFMDGVEKALMTQLYGR